ncbi:hypothetical protein HOA55_05130 [archaeon]|nr:hypothetical protein [archaeon]MBT6820712.1 hypothetical protein [archaeon]MBT6955973.1 hypothetical protein [archaeon]MBT7024879.1 hypothetical protein [archaeon]MBT7238498.1 hypothetical protein [archaeon]
MGHQISLTDIENPHIRRAIKQRGGFLFKYKEVEDYDDLPHPHYQAYDDSDDYPDMD